MAFSEDALRGGHRSDARKRGFRRRSFSLLAITSLAVVAANCTTYSDIEMSDRPGSGGTAITTGAGGKDGTGSGGSGIGGTGGTAATTGTGATGGSTGGSGGQGGGGAGGSGGVPDASATGGSSGGGGSTMTGGAAGGVPPGTGGSGATGGGAGATGGGGSGGAAGNGGSVGTGGSAGTAGSTGSGGAAGTAGSGGMGGASGSAGTAGSGATGGMAGTGGTGGSAGTGGAAGKGGTSGAGGSGGTMDAGPATCTSYVPDSTYPCVMGIPPNCGSNPVNCGATICPANSSCGTGNTCPCNTGFIAVACANGQKCSSATNPCAGGQWGCYPKPEPGCTGNPSQTEGVCTCSDGKTYNLMCGSTTTCDQHCRQGS